MGWIWWMFLWSVAGAFAGLFWPALVGWFKRNRPDYQFGITRAGGTGATRWVLLFLVGAVIAAIAAAIGFAAFLADEANRRELQALGSVAYFMAFSYGFGASSLIEEGLKK